MSDKINIRKVEKCEIKQVLEIYEIARQTMRESGNPNQWKGSYPERELIEKDIIDGVLYTVESEGELCAVFVFQGEDSAYDKLVEGEWLNREPYFAIHRVASNGRIRGALTYIMDYCKSFGKDLKIDTHPDNKIMQHLLEKNGFAKCGIVQISPSEARIAYHYVKQQSL